MESVGEGRIEEEGVREEGVGEEVVEEGVWMRATKEDYPSYSICQKSHISEE